MYPTMMNSKAQNFFLANEVQVKVGFIVGQISLLSCQVTSWDTLKVLRSHILPTTQNSVLGIFAGHNYYGQHELCSTFNFFSGASNFVVLCAHTEAADCSVSNRTHTHNHQNTNQLKTDFTRFDDILNMPLYYFLFPGQEKVFIVKCLLLGVKKIENYLTVAKQFRDN